MGCYSLEVNRIIQSLEKSEEESILNMLAMMAYNPSIGRVLKKGGVNEFVSITKEMIHEIKDILSRDEFDKWHNKFLETIINTIGKTSNEKPISYGQAQKPVNVFLKIYVDWAGKPQADIAIRLRPYLHVPLDSRVIKYTKKHFTEYCQKYELKVMSLSKITEKNYYSWQNCFRELSPKKPLIIDVIWALERFA